LQDDDRPTLKQYFARFGCKGFKDFFTWLMKTVKPIRLTGAHHKSLIDQDRIDQSKYKIKDGEDIKEIDIDFLQVCKEGLGSFITLI